MRVLIISEEEKVKKMGLVKSDPDDPDSINAFFIQILDSKGQNKATTSQCSPSDI